MRLRRRDQSLSLVLSTHNQLSQQGLVNATMIQTRHVKVNQTSRRGRHLPPTVVVYRLLCELVDFSSSVVCTEYLGKQAALSYSTG